MAKEEMTRDNDLKTEVSNEKALESGNVSV